ncbi:TetR/AcrR family transcriptional regulator C-terminal domain-containing protein [uncultured Agrococcus sp.]|uniref:TetR/AcrR family transcriptional regulator n=1 Tax=uncultured Agrococcus sp. TaxID=382258 RepID=UPI0025D9AB9D|nr:TetR/AcrR family transcriptional regulator C-terminal domain-containing protein [uncultured Agrococcus sp.]
MNHATGQSESQRQDSKRRQGRPASPLLDRERITNTAMSLIRDSGADALTMGALARALGVTTPALYNHAANKLVILRWVEDRLMERIETGDFTEGDWFGALATWASSYRTIMAENAPFIPTVATMPVAGAPITLTMYERVASGLAESGWPDTAIVPVIVSVESFVYGSAYDVDAPDDIFAVAEDERDGAPQFVRAVAAYSERTKAPRRRADEAFETGLAALLRGLAERYGVASPG